MAGETREEVYRFIVAFKSEHDGASPTLDEIKDAVGIGKTTVVYHIEHDDRLEQCGVRWIKVIAANEVINQEASQ